MEILKSLEQITEMDVRNRVHPATLTHRHKQVSDLELSPDVPERIASAFAVARNLWLYGWFYWPLYTLASYEAYRCIEMALINRWRNEVCPPRKSKHTPTLAVLLEQAVKKGWLRDADFQHVRRHQEMQRRYNELMDGILPQEPTPPLEPDRYVKILKEVLPQLRNRHAHPEGITITGPGDAVAYLETARDIIQKLFPAS